MRINVLGTTAPVQMAKIQLKPMWIENGWQFCDINDIVCELRKKGTARYKMYESSFPGCLKENGHKFGRFYVTVSHEFYMQRLLEEMTLVVPLVQEVCAKAEGQKIVLSWEYLPFIAKFLPLDHTLLFTSDRQIWFERIRRRSIEVGIEGVLSDKQIKTIIDMLDVEPDTVLKWVQQYMSDKFTTLDVSDPDWGKARVLDWLKQHE